MSNTVTKYALVLVGIMTGLTGCADNLIRPDDTHSNDSHHNMVAKSKSEKPAPDRAGTAGKRIDKNKREHCQIVRDLTQPWKPGSFWCDTQDQGSFGFSIGHQYSVNKKTIAQLKTITTRLQTYLHPRSHATIMFTHHVTVLDQRGRVVAKDLIAQVNHANRVLIRGVIMPDELADNTPLCKERTSVARAFAVRKYWQQHGVDTSNVTILHYKPTLTGHTVEVTLK